MCFCIFVFLRFRLILTLLHYIFLICLWLLGTAPGRRGTGVVPAVVGRWYGGGTVLPRRQVQKTMKKGTRRVQGRRRRIVNKEQGRKNEEGRKCSMSNVQCSIIKGKTRKAVSNLRSKWKTGNMIWKKGLLNIPVE